MKKAFRFGKHKGPAKPKHDPKVPKLKDPRDAPPFYVRGILADSRDEYWVSLALEKIEKQTGWTWEYQVPVRGGRRRRGGNVIDFLIDTPGRKTALDPMGRVWHTGRREDRQQMESVTREKGWNLLAWFTDQTPTKESVYQFLRAQLHI